MRNKGFLGVEWVVAIGITLILMVMITPILGNVKEGGKEDCMSNLKQIGVALNMFAQDHQGNLPVYGHRLNGDPHNEYEFYYPGEIKEGGDYTHLGLLYAGGYLKDGHTFYCPDDQEWTYNSQWVSNQPTKPRTVAGYLYRYTTSIPYRIDSFKSLAVVADRFFDGIAHQDGYNVLYGDGSVKWYSDPAGSVKAPGGGPVNNGHDDVWSIFDSEH